MGLSASQFINEGVADSSGNGAAPFSSFSDDIRDAGFHDDVFGVFDIDEADGNADDEGRRDASFIDEFFQAQKGCRRIADGDDERSRKTGGLIHRGLSPRRPLFPGRSGYVGISHEADLLAAQFRKTGLTDAHTGHIGIGHDGAAAFQGF